MGSEEIQIIVSDYVLQKLPNLFIQVRMPFDAQKNSWCTLRVVIHQPMVYFPQFAEQLHSQHGNLRVLTDESCLNRKKAWFSVLEIIFNKTFQFLCIFIEEIVKKSDPCEIILHSFDNNVGEVFVLIGEQPQDLLYWHI